MVIHSRGQISVKGENMKLYVVAYVNQKGQDVFNMSVNLLTQEVWAHSEEEVIGILHKAKDPPQNFDKIIMNEVSVKTAQEILDKAKE